MGLQLRYLQKLMALKLSVNLLKLHRLKNKPKSRPIPDVPMRFVQFRRNNDPLKHLGVVSEDGRTLVPLSLGSCCSNDMITFLTQDIGADEIIQKIKTQPSEKVTEQLILLPPITNPGKIICIGLNYVDNCRQQRKPPPGKPIFSSKYTSSLVGPTENIIAHKVSQKIDWEVELAVIIGKTAKNVPRERALDYVFGYSVAQDISARDWQKDPNGGQFLIGKSMDTFCPLGPAIVHKSLIKDPYNLQIKTKVNGVTKQNSNTNMMIYKIDHIIHTLTKGITLKPGDVILTGTPAGCGMLRNPPEYLRPGDVIESEIESIGKLINKVVSD